MLIGGWKLIDDHVTHETGSVGWKNGQLGLTMRQILRKTYQIYTDDPHVPEEPSNPENLDTTLHRNVTVMFTNMQEIVEFRYFYWFCSDFHVSMDYASPFGTLTETWEYTSDWIFVPLPYVTDSETYIPI